MSSPVTAFTTLICEVLDEQDDVGPVVGSADADVAEAAVVADGDGPGFVDAVVAIRLWVSGSRESVGMALGRVL